MGVSHGAFYKNLPAAKQLSWIPASAHIPAPLPRLSTPLPFSFERERDGGEIKGLFCQNSFPCSEGAQLWRFCLASLLSAVLQCEWCSKAALMIQGCFCKCYLCTVRNGDLRQMGPFLLSRILWRVCIFSWGPRQVHCLLFSKIGPFHHRKWDCACKDLEISY